MPFAGRLTNVLTKKKNGIAEDGFRLTVAILGEDVNALSISQTGSPAKISRNGRAVQIARADGDVSWRRGGFEIWIKRINSIDSIVMQHKEAAEGRIGNSSLAARMKISSCRSQIISPLDI